MAKQKKTVNRGLITLSKGERIAVIDLLVVIVILLGINIFLPVIKSSKRYDPAFHRLDSLIAAREVQRSILEDDTPEDDVVVEKETVKSPVTRRQPQPAAATVVAPPKPEAKKIPILDINEADSTQLTALPQIGEVMASRIQRYRERLGGFVALEQLYEIKYMDTARFQTIQPYIILETNEIHKINVNQDDFKTLLRHPYLDYEQVKAIVNHRERRGLIRDWKQLQELVGEVNPRLEDYVTY